MSALLIALVSVGLFALTERAISWVHHLGSSDAIDSTEMKIGPWNIVVVNAAPDLD